MTRRRSQLFLARLDGCRSPGRRVRALPPTANSRFRISWDSRQSGRVPDPCQKKRASGVPDGHSEHSEQPLSRGEGPRLLPELLPSSRAATGLDDLPMTTDLKVTRTLGF